MFHWLVIHDLVIFGLILHMVGSVLNTYGSNLKSINHSYFYTRQFSPVAHTFPSLALYPHGVTKSLVLAGPYDIYTICHVHLTWIQINKEIFKLVAMKYCLTNDGLR